MDGNIVVSKYCPEDRVFVIGRVTEQELQDPDWVTKYLYPRSVVLILGESEGTR